MKKRLICFLILSSFIIGLVFVGSCKDYDDFALDIRVENLENKLNQNCENLSDTIDSIKARLGRIKECACTPSNIKDSIAVLYEYLGDVLKDTVVSADSANKTFKGIQNVINYLNKRLSNVAVTADSAYSIADSLRQLRFGWGDSLKLAYDTILMLNRSVEKIYIRLDSIKMLDSVIKVKDSLTQVRIDSVIKEYKKADSAQQASIDTLFKHDSIINASIKELIKQDSVHTARIDSLAKVTYQLDSLAKDYRDTAMAWADTVANRVKVALNDRIDSVIKEYNKADSAINKRIDACLDTMRLNWNRIQQINDTLNVIDSTLKSHKIRLDSIDLRLDSLELRMDSLELRVDTLELKVDSLRDAEMKRISSIIIQGTENNVFGSFALPFNVKSNILMAYSTKFNGADFPTRMPGLKGSDVISSKDAEVIPLTFEQSLDGETVISGGTASDNAGKLYFTLNPNDVKIDSTYHFSLINSLGAKTPVTIDSVRKSEKKLSFGYSAAKNASQVVENDINTVNGFYQADINIAAADAYSLRPDLDESALAAVARDIKNYRDGIDLGNLASTMLSSVDGVLDANALYVTWEDKFGKHSATSEYNLAVATIKPLSYNTIDKIVGKIPSVDIPKNPIHYLLNELKVPSITLKFDTIKIDDLTITIDTVKFSLPDKVDSLTVKIDVKVPVDMKADVVINDTLKGDSIHLKGNATVKDSLHVVHTTKVALNDVYTTMNNRIEALLDSMNLSLKNVNGKINSSVNNIQDQIQTQVNKMLTSIQGTVNQSVTDIVGDIKTQIGNNKFVKKIEKLANKLNNYYEHIDGLAREMVQPTLLYAANGDFHPVSKSEVVPTSLAGTGTYELVITSLTNEIITPAYKKYIAVTNFRDASTGQDWQNDDQNKDYILDIVNKAGDFGQLLDGDTKIVKFEPTKKGIYEILISTIDYSGYMYHRKFYVNVK
jgi:hypothetical protein